MTSAYYVHTPYIVPLLHMHKTPKMTRLHNQTTLGTKDIQTYNGKSTSEMLFVGQTKVTCDKNHPIRFYTKPPLV